MTRLLRQRRIDLAAAREKGIANIFRVSNVVVDIAGFASSDQWGPVLLFGDPLFPGVAKIYLFLALFLVPLNFLFSFVSYLVLGLQKIKEYNFVSTLQSFIDKSKHNFTFCSRKIKPKVQIYQ